jgi:DNA-binding CsgD family transcriptional regulator
MSRIYSCRNIKKQMNEQNNIGGEFFKHLLEYKFDAKDLDYSLLDKHLSVLQTFATIGNSGIGVFDISKREMVFFSANYGQLLGYFPSEFKEPWQQFFDSKLHPEDKLKLSSNGIATLKIFNNFSNEDKFKHKLINEYRMLNAQNKYTRLIEQFQVLELDKKGQIWLMVGFVDISPHQEEYEGIKSQLFNFKTGQMVSFDITPKVEFELTKREVEVLKLVKDGFLSKEISSKLAISVHTVNTHRQRFLEKLGADNSFEAVKFASSFGLLN